MRLSDGLNGVEAGGGLKGDAWLEHFGRWVGRRLKEGRLSGCAKCECLRASRWRWQADVRARDSGPQTRRGAAGTASEVTYLKLSHQSASACVLPPAWLPPSHLLEYTRVSVSLKTPLVPSPTLRSLGLPFSLVLS